MNHQAVPSFSSGLAPTRTVLGSGAVFIGKQTPTMPAVAINIAMEAGSI